MVPACSNILIHYNYVTRERLERKRGSLVTTPSFTLSRAYHAIQAMRLEILYEVAPEVPVCLMPFHTRHVGPLA